MFGLTLNIGNPFQEIAQAMGLAAQSAGDTSTPPGQSPAASQSPARSPAPAAAHGAVDQPTSDIILRRRQAIAGMESSGRYNIVGATHPKYGRALGKYQVMESNLPSWSKRALGRVYTPNEFLADEAAQDKVFDTIFGGELVPKYGEEGAARAWLGGAGGVRNTKAADKFGTTTGAYGQRYMARLSGKSGKSGQGIVGRTPASSPQMAVDASPQAGVVSGQPIVGTASAPAPGPEKPTVSPTQAFLGKLAKGMAQVEDVPPPELPATQGAYTNALAQQRFQNITEQVLQQNFAAMRGLPDTDKIKLLHMMGQRAVTSLAGKGAQS